eukprot:6192574-Pleurochrysis_carterae.AAC.1
MWARLCEQLVLHVAALCVAEVQPASPAAPGRAPSRSSRSSQVRRQPGRRRYVRGRDFAPAVGLTQCLCRFT